MGQFSRRGQKRDGAGNLIEFIFNQILYINYLFKACGAAVGALNHCLACKPIPNRDHLGDKPFDYQMSYIISEVSKRLNKITSMEDENERQAALVQQMYEISKGFLEEIATLDFGSVHSHLILLGGIQINMPGLLTGERFSHFIIHIFIILMITSHKCNI